MAFAVSLKPSIDVISCRPSMKHQVFGGHSQVFFNSRPTFTQIRFASPSPLPSSSPCSKQVIDDFLNGEYKYGFKSDLDSYSIDKGLSEDTIKQISSLKHEPDWMLSFRLESYRRFLNMVEPTWSDNRYKPLNLQDLCYYSAPKKRSNTPEVRELLHKLDSPLSKKKNRSGVAMDLVVDSGSLGTEYTNRKVEKKLKDDGIIFCPMSEAIRKHPELVRKYLSKVVPSSDNYYAALNSAVFSDGSFCYIPKGVRCKDYLSTYFRINDPETGQFERTLIIADEGSVVDYVEACTAVSQSSKQLHAAVVELYAAAGAQINYFTVQNWYSGDKEGTGGIYNFVTKRGLCAGRGSRISWTQAEVGSAITWKYPSVVLEGDDSVGEFYSVAVTNKYQQADTGSKMIHKGKNTRSLIVSKGISAGNSRNVYRGLVKIHSGATNARNSSQCDSMLIGDQSAAHTYPYIEAKTPSARVEHEASTSRISLEQMFYCQQRGINKEQAMSMIITTFTKRVLERLPREFSVETRHLLTEKLEGSVG